MSHPSISVIIPHYNRPELLECAIQSILHQTLKPAEIVVVDDCSSPESRGRLDSLSQFARIVDLPRNVGLSGARNAGARVASGEWLAFLDDDDVYLPCKLGRQFRYLENHPECVALGGGLTLDRSYCLKRHSHEEAGRRIRLADALYYPATLAQSLVIRRDAFLEIGGFDERLRRLEDYDLGIRIVASGSEMHFFRAPLFVYSFGEREQLTRNWGKMLSAELRVLRLHRGLCRQEFGPLGYARLVSRCCRLKGRIGKGLAGRFVSLLGVISEAIIGKERGEYD